MLLCVTSLSFCLTLSFSLFHSLSLSFHNFLVTGFWYLTGIQRLEVVGLQREWTEQADELWIPCRGAQCWIGGSVEHQQVQMNVVFIKTSKHALDLFAGMKVNFCGITFQTGHSTCQITWEGKMRRFLLFYQWWVGTDFDSCSRVSEVHQQFYLTTQNPGLQLWNQ